ncbi:AraC-type DNA-binding protein [Chryseolinea serpens]|uniref:AraC-type DNA-binding protein n=1 Tax=Chryseolinea serpens TaxID=947013 RepID=A0A1M5RSR2_9BACT|nr:AraC family transcriptional regulator [Chryseolinea serpens]SHH29189.1 AraC-type DNA-binding protein [Chryseolinea serpens]
MAQKNSTSLPHILYSCYSHKSSEGEQFVPDHIFGYTLSGSSDLHQEGKTYHFNEGDFRFLRRNQLAKYTKRPPTGGEYRSISIAIDQETLRAISMEHNLHASKPYEGENVLKLEPSLLLKNFIDSLTPYLNATSDLSKSITELKVKEAVMLLLQTYPELKDALFDFSAPGKVDLEAYMHQHYKFNVDLSRFAYLTGRSLATFKRDFERIFHTSPNRWLQQQRLKDAYYLIKEKGHRVSDVYLDVGFKDLSHFSFAFKKAFGVAPSKVASEPSPVAVNAALAN